MRLGTYVDWKKLLHHKLTNIITSPLQIALPHNQNKKWKRHVSIPNTRFFKSNSHDRNLHYKLCVAINHVMPNEIKAAQQIRGLWKIYLTTQDAKETLVRNGFRFNNNHPHFYMAVTVSIFIGFS